MTFKIPLNRVVRDAVTGFTGHTTARAEYIASPNQYLVERNDATGRPVAEWIAEPRLVNMGPSVNGNPEMSLIEAAEQDQRQQDAGLNAETPSAD